VGTLVSEVLYSGSLSDWIVIKLAKRNNHQKTPEMRIWLTYPAVILTAVGLVVWGVSIDREYHWMVGQVALAICKSDRMILSFSTSANCCYKVGAGVQMGNTAICSYVVDAYPLQSMAMMTFYAVMLNLSAFLDPFFIVSWVDNIGFTWTFIGHAIITVVVCIPVMAVLHRFGRTLCEKSGSPTWVNPEYKVYTHSSI